MEAISYTPEHKFNNFLAKQSEIESKFCNLHQKKNGVFLTSDSSVINSVLAKVPNDESIFSFSYLEPSCGYGAFLIRLIIKAYLVKPNKTHIEKFIQDKLYFVDIDPEMVRATEINIRELFSFLFKVEYSGVFNSHVSDFTILTGNGNLQLLYGKMDFVIGNPPYVT
jgi:type I restriction-modification system DNA methylase subunit